jgi:hypothetical protein
MPDDNPEDPAANTQMFQAFVDNYPDPEPSRSGRVWAAVGVVALLVVVIALVWVLVAR